MSTLRRARRLRPWLVSVVVLRPEPDGTKVLLMKRNHPPIGIWCQVAGKIESNEMAWAAGLRELREETGLTPTRYYSADVCEEFYEVCTDEIVIAPVFVAFVQEDVEVQLNDEHSEYLWLDMREAISRLSFAGQKRVMREVEAGFVKSEPLSLLEIQLPSSVRTE
ncbi:NUDIX hydrolase [Aliiroseovarius crassostreae]|uniref:NUDIX hydrolase n=1 Tax=Aliiroseovarius crassostreae TaxID=154981 RepID=UPI003C7BF3CD